MSQHQIRRESDRAYVIPGDMNDGIPPRQPSVMPTQVITFWTPTVIGVSLLRSVIRRSPAGIRRAVASAANSDEPG